MFGGNADLRVAPVEPCGVLAELDLPAREHPRWLRGGPEPVDTTVGL